MNIDWSKAPEGAEFYTSRPASGLSYYRSIQPDTYEFWNEHQPHWRIVKGAPGDYAPIPCGSRGGYGQTRQEIIDLAWKECGVQGDFVRQLATVLVNRGYRKFEIVEEDV
jgi:hypothetical protein